MQDEVNEKTVALYIKTGKLTAEVLQKAMKAALTQSKKQIGKQPHGKQTLKQLMIPTLQMMKLKSPFAWRERKSPRSCLPKPCAACRKKSGTPYCSTTSLT